MSVSFLHKDDYVAATRCSSQLISFFHRFIFDAENIATPVSLTFGSKLAEGSSDPLLRVLQLWDVKHWAVGYIKHSTSQVQRTESLESDSGTESDRESNCDHCMMKTEHYSVFVYFTAGTNGLENVICSRIYTSEGSVGLRIGRGRYFKRGGKWALFLHTYVHQDLLIDVEQLPVCTDPPDQQRMHPRPVCINYRRKSDCKSAACPVDMSQSRGLFTSTAPKKNRNRGNEVLPHDTTYLIQRPCYQRGSPCQYPAGNRTTQRHPDYGKEPQTTVVWSCLTFIRSGQNHFARHCETGKKTRQTE